MAKRFTDTCKWQKGSFTELSNTYKLVWFYLCDNCNHAGIWDVNFKLISFQLDGVVISRDSLDAHFGDKIVWLSDTKLFIPSFVEFQYGELDEMNRAHRSVISILKKEGAYKGLTSSIQGAKDKDKDKDKDKEKGECEGKKQTRKKHTYPTGFEEVYSTYPRQEGKKRGYAIYQREIKSPEDRQNLILAVQNYRQKKSGTDPDYLMHFDTFMGEWTDWIDSTTGQTVANKNYKSPELEALDKELGIRDPRESI